jgi:hypothetical protein
MIRMLFFKALAIFDLYVMSFFGFFWPCCFNLNPFNVTDDCSSRNASCALCSNQLILLQKYKTKPCVDHMSCFWVCVQTCYFFMSRMTHISIVWGRTILSKVKNRTDYLDRCTNLIFNICIFDVYFEIICHTDGVLLNCWH